LQKLAAAYLKKQWGTNIKKYANVSLIAGVTIDGNTIYQEGVAESAEAETSIRDNYEIPPIGFFE
jgi:hypothetical protein